jgi:hypothetical protein
MRKRRAQTALLAAAHATFRIEVCSATARKVINPSAAISAPDAKL